MGVATIHIMSERMASSADRIKCIKNNNLPAVPHRLEDGRMIRQSRFTVVYKLFTYEIQD